MNSSTLFLTLILPFAVLPSVSEATVALVSTDREPYAAFDVAEEAIGQGADLLIFPEWGFQPQDDIPNDLVQKWRQLADDKNVQIVLGARSQKRNTVFVFGADGSTRLGFRRDGHNSPVPTEDMYKRPLVFDTPYGKAGVLICDESRMTKYVDELKTYSPKIVLVPNSIGISISEDELKTRYAKFSPGVPSFHTDILNVNGNQTHAYFPVSSVFEVNAFGANRPLGSSKEFKTDLAGNKYSISYHVLP